MPTFRPNTWDENIWNSIVIQNEYGIHNNWPGIVIDIGGHIGSFSYFMLQYKQAKKVIVIEPDPYNFKILTTNLQEFIDTNRVVAINAGIGKPNSQLKLFAPIHDNTGGISYVSAPNGDIQTITLDNLIDLADNESILLKVDCEGCEYEALRCCTKLQKIQAIVGEFHVRLDCGPETLRSLLESNNFAFRYHFTSSSNNIGLFGAHQT